MKRRSTLIPLCLFAYLLFMAIYFGYPSYQRGALSGLEFAGIVVASLVTIVLLHFSLKKRDRLRREREQDLKK